MYVNLAYKVQIRRLRTFAETIAAEVDAKMEGIANRLRFVSTFVDITEAADR
jgi:hypothetical protein